MKYEIHSNNISNVICYLTDMTLTHHLQHSSCRLATLVYTDKHKKHINTLCEKYVGLNAKTGVHTVYSSPPGFSGTPPDSHVAVQT